MCPRDQDAADGAIQQHPWGLDTTIRDGQCMNALVGMQGGAIRGLRRAFSSRSAGRSTSELLFGVHPVQAAIAFQSRPLIALHVLDEAVDAAEVLLGAASAKGARALVESAAFHGQVPSRDAISSSICDQLVSNLHRAFRAVAASGPARVVLTSKLVREDLAIHRQTRQGLDTLLSRSRTKQVGKTVHQGVVLETQEMLLPVGSADAFAERHSQRPVIVVLDQVTDPQNFGAIARSCLFFGVDALVTSSKNCAPPNASASKASAGALEQLGGTNRLFQVTSTHKFLQSLRESDWHVVAADVPDEGDAATVSSSWPEMPRLFSRPTAIVLGSEGGGIRPIVRACCDDTLTIPSSVPAGSDSFRCDSLNVSAAAAVLFSWVAQSRAMVRQ
jgi:tRNA G18 (ribose-2'-O)-methylase SpoU